MKLRYTNLLTCVVIAACGTPAEDVGNLETHSGWVTASPSSVGLDGELLDRSTEDVRAGRWGNIHALIVARKGRLVHEAYFGGQDEIRFEGYRYVEFGPTVKHELRSVSKSFTSTLVGIAIDQGFIDSVDVPLSVALPEYAKWLTGDKANLTLRHALTMSAGLRWAEGGKVENDADDDQYDLAEAKDPLEAVLARESESSPGAEFNYSGGLTQILAAVVERATGMPFLEYADSVLFGPLGIEDWEWFALGNAQPAAWSGLKINATDMAKLGQVYLNGGQWQGHSIVSRNWIDAAFENWIEAPSPRAPSYVTYSGYGFQWWYDVHEWDRDSLVFHSAIGNGGQRIIVIPDLNIVVAVFAGFYEDPSNSWTPEALVREYVLPAVIGPP